MSEEAYYQSMKKINFIPALCLEHQLYHQAKAVSTNYSRNFFGTYLEEIILCLVRAGMVLTNVSLWKTFATAGDSSYEIGNPMKYS